MFMWDLHKIGWCAAQTEPMSQLGSLRNGNTHTYTHTLKETHNPFLWQSLCLPIFHSQTLLHIHNNTDPLTHVSTHKQTSAPLGGATFGPCSWRRENAETGEIKDQSGNKREGASEKGGDWHSIPNSRRWKRRSCESQNVTKGFSSSCLYRWKKWECTKVASFRKALYCSILIL